MTTKRWMILLIASMLLSGFTGYGWGSDGEADCTCTVEIPPCICECKLPELALDFDKYRAGWKAGYEQGKADAECPAPEPQPEVEIKVQPASYKNSVSVQGGNETALAGYTRRLSQHWGVGSSILWDWRDDVTVDTHPCRDWYCRPADPATVERSRTVVLGSVTYWF